MNKENKETVAIKGTVKVRRNKEVKETQQEQVKQEQVREVLPDLNKETYKVKKKEVKKDSIRIQQDQNMYEEGRPKVQYKDGRNWIGNIVKDRPPIISPEEYWAGVRKEILPEHLALFDSTQSTIIKGVLKEANGVLPEYRFQISLLQFKKLTEQDFLSLKEITDHIKIRACDAGDILKAILYKKEVEHYSLDFKFSDQSIKDIFGTSWEHSFYTLYLIG